MAYDVFISYAAEDRTVANAVCATLEANRIRCWVAPRDVLPGMSYAEALIDAISESSLMVLVFSSRSNNSPQVMREVERAASKGIPILPFRIEDVALSKSMEFFLSTPHWLDALTPPLEKHLGHLAGTVKLLLSRIRKPEEVAAEANGLESAGAAVEPTIEKGPHGPTPVRKALELGVVVRWGGRPVVRLAAVFGAVVGSVVIAIFVLVELVSDGGTSPLILPPTPGQGSPTAAAVQPTGAATPGRPSATPTRTSLPSPTPAPTLTPTPVERSPKVLWRSETWAPAVYTSPAVVDGVVYVGAHDQNVYALDAAAGEERWHFETGGLIYSSPAVVEGVLYIGSNDSYVYALDAASGEERWRFKTDDAVFSSPTVVGGVVYIGSWDGYAYALDATIGEKRWRFKMGDQVSSPAVAEGVVYVTSCDGIYALDAATGEQRWNVGGWGCVSSSPVVVDGVVYIATSGDVRALDAATGDELWRFAGYLGGQSDPAVVDGVIYIGGRDGYVYALDGSTGEQLWRVETGDWVEAGLGTWRFEPGGGELSSPTVANGIVYIGSTDNCLYALDAAMGEQLWRFETGFWVASRPAVVDGVIYFGSVDGYVYAITED